MWQRKSPSFLLVTAITSFLTLQSVALTTFSHNVNVPFVNGLTGVIVCGLIVSSGVIMIVNATLRIKKLTSSS